MSDEKSSLCEKSPMKQIYVVASNTDVTVICKANSSEDAIRIATDKWHEQGYGFEQDFTAYLADEYFEDDDDALIFP